MITVFVRKSTSLIIFVKDKISDFIDWHPFYGCANILGIHYKKTEKVKNNLIETILEFYTKMLFPY